MSRVCHAVSALGVIAWLQMAAGGMSAGTASASASDRLPPLTLRECYALSLERSEQLAIHQALIAETEGRFLQSLSGLLPRVSFSSTDKRQDASGESAFKLRHVPERKFVFNQPLFSGFKEFAALAGARAERRQRTFERERAAQALFVDVAEAFHLLRERREDLQALEATRLALMERVEELEARERLGRSRRSEVASAEAQLRRLEADIEQGHSDEVIAQQLLAFLTGLDQIEALAETPPLLAVDAEEAYVAKGAARPDVRATEEAWQVAQRQVTIARAQFFPTVELEGNYYTKRVGASEGVNWDAQVAVEVPLFQGGQAAGAVREASARARQAKLQFEHAQRAAELDIRDAYARLRRAVTKTQVLERAQAAAQESYRLQLEDYQRTLVNNLDVLQALQTLQDAHRDVIHARHETQRFYWQLRVAVGDFDDTL